MAKKTSDSNKRYEAEHTRNIARYQRQIDEIYKEAVREAASISSLIRNFSSDKPFKFVDYPITQQRVDKLLKGLKTALQRQS